MNTVAFDTLKLVRSLRDKAKFSPEQAEGLADAMAEAMQGDIATKVDIDALRVSTKADLRETQLRLEVKIEASKSEIIKWMFGTIGFQTIIILGAAIALARIVAR